MAKILHETVNGLSNDFTRSDKTPEEIIYELFRIPNKEEAAMGKLIAVRFYWMFSEFSDFLGLKKLWNSRQWSTSQQNDGTNVGNWKKKWRNE